MHWIRSRNGRPVHGGPTPLSAPGLQLGLGDLRPSYEMASSQPATLCGQPVSVSAEKILRFDGDRRSAPGIGGIGSLLTRTIMKLPPIIAREQRRAWDVLQDYQALGTSC